jgi:hypothetical protein
MLCFFYRNRTTKRIEQEQQYRKQNEEKQKMFWIVEKTVASLLFIIISHHLLLYFQTTLTLPKQKDLFYGPIKKYSKMYETIKQQKGIEKEKEKEKEEKIAEHKSETMDTLSMKNELKEYIQKNLRI